MQREAHDQCLAVFKLELQTFPCLVLQHKLVCIVAPLTAAETLNTMTLERDC